MATSSEKPKRPEKKAPVIERLVRALRRDATLRVDSAQLGDEDVSIVLSSAGGRVNLRLRPICDHPHYARTGHFIVYYQGTGDLDEVSRGLLEKAVTTLRGIEDTIGGLPVKWPPAIPSARGRVGEGASPEGGGTDGTGPVVINRWKDPRTGKESLEVTLRVWDRCNQRCSFCQVEGRRWSLTHGMILRTIKKYGTGRPPARLNLTGGEPTLNLRLHDYVKTALKMKYTTVVVQTNAVMYSGRKLSERMPVSDRLLFFVSFHGFDEATYDEATRTRGQYSRAILGINNLLSRGLKVTLNVVFTSGNLFSFPNLVKSIPILFPGYKGALELQLSAIGGFPSLKERTALLPRLGDVYRVTRGAVEEARGMGIRVYDFATSGFCTLPPCILSAGQRRLIRGLMANMSDFGPVEVVEGRIEKDGSSLVKSPTCRACLFNSSCPGVLREYGLAYGLGELRAIKGGR